MRSAVRSASTPCQLRVTSFASKSRLVDRHPLYVSAGAAPHVRASHYGLRLAHYSEHYDHVPKITTDWQTRSAGDEELTPSKPGLMVGTGQATGQASINTPPWSYRLAGNTLRIAGQTRFPSCCSTAFQCGWELCLVRCSGPHWHCSAVRVETQGRGTPGHPQGAYPRPRARERNVMREPDPVRVLGSMRPEDCPTREHAPRGVREFSSCRTASAGR